MYLTSFFIYREERKKKGPRREDWRDSKFTGQSFSYIYRLWMNAFCHVDRFPWHWPTCFWVFEICMTFAFVPTATGHFLTLEPIRCSTHCPGDRAPRRHTHSIPPQYSEKAALFQQQPSPVVLQSVPQHRSETGHAMSFVGQALAPGGRYLQSSAPYES